MNSTKYLLRGNPRLLSLSLIIMFLLASQLQAVATPEQLFDAVRENRAGSIKAYLAAGVPVDTRNGRGDTPLIVASMVADKAVIRALLEGGADPNAANHEGATALFRAASRPDLAQMLMDAGADVKTRSKLGNTPLIIAARQRGSSGLVKQMLEAGADPNAANNFGTTALIAAAAASDIETVKLLLDSGANINAKPESSPNGFVFGGGRSALMWAAFRGDTEMLHLLIERKADLESSTIVGNALTQAAWGGHASAARILIEAGAKVDARDPIGNYTPLHWAASAELEDTRLVALLIERGADPHSPGGEPVDTFLGELQSPLGLAQKRGDTAIARLLANSVNDPSPNGEDFRSPDKTRAPARPDKTTVAVAAARAISPLQKSAAASRDSFLRHVSKQNCLSCHQQYVPMAAVGMARELGFPIDEPAAREQITLSTLHPSVPSDFEAQATMHPEAGIEIGLHLLGLHYEKQNASHLTDMFVHYLAAEQNTDGRWHVNMPRPPIQDSDVVATAYGIFGLKSYPLPGRKDEFQNRIKLAADWLRQQQVETNNERVFRILGLHWAGQSPESLSPYLLELMATQRADGGWGQLKHLPSDAYATGHVLFALAKAGNLTLDNLAVQRGVQFLLSTQATDGTWHVRSRTFPFQPPMSSGFPYGSDSWLSAAGTSWAAIGLLSLLDPSNPPKITADMVSIPTEPQPVPDLPGVDPLTVPHDFVRQIQPVLERSCLSCHSGEKPKGGFRVDGPEFIFSGGNRGDAAIIPGNPEASRIIECITDTIEDLEMPPLGKREKFPALTEQEIASFRAWIKAGAKWPEGTRLEKAGEK